MRLGDICNIGSGGTPSRKKLEFYGGDIPWAKISDIENAKNGILTITEENITKEGLNNIRNKLFSEGTLLFAMYGSIGKVAITGRKMATNQAILGITPKDKNIISLDYLKIWFEANKQQLLNQGRGVTLKNLSATIIKDLDVPIPAYKTQLHIANILSKAESLIAQRKESIRLLDEYLKSVFLAMFGDPEHNINNYPVVELESLCSEIVDCPHSTPRKVEDKTEYPCIRTSELSNGYIDWDSMQYLDEEEYKIRTKRLIPVGGDIVYAREGTFGESVVLPNSHKFSLGQRTMLFRPDKTKTNSIFLWAMVRSDYVYRQAKRKNSGSTVGHVNVKDIKKFKILQPPQELQNKFSSIVLKLENLKAQYQQSIQELENLYGSLSQKAFKGELNLKDESLLMAAESEVKYEKNK